MIGITAINGISMDDLQGNDDKSACLKAVKRTIKKGYLLYRHPLLP